MSPTDVSWWSDPEEEWEKLRELDNPEEGISEKEDSKECQNPEAAGNVEDGE